MALSDTSKINISIKKLSGKAQTSNDKDLANEGLPTGVTLGAETIFGEIIPSTPTSTSLYNITSNRVEYLRLSASFIAGTDTSSGRHAFSLKLPDDYETRSSNTKKGTYPFINGQIIYITSGALQLVPTSFSTDYEAIPYHTSSGTETRIPVLDARDWNLDYFNGIFFQQDPPGTGDNAQNPRYVDAFLYIGDFVSDKVGIGNGDANATYLVLTATGSLPNERVFTTGTGLSATDAGAGGAYTVKVLDSVFAALTGSVFSGAVSSPAFSGSLTKLQDGSSYLIAGSNTTIVTGSSGAVTISSAGSVDGSGASNRIATWSDSNTLTSDSDLTWDGTTLYATSAGTTLNIQGDTNLNGTVVINQSGVDKDFRVETQNKSSALQVDGGTDQVLLFSGSLSDAAGYGSSGSDPDPRSFIDTNFFVSGSIGSRDTSRRGTSVFGGDVLSSGSLVVKNGITGSLTKLADGSSYLRSGTGISISSSSNGSIEISSTATSRTKINRRLTGSIGNGSDCDLNIDFSSVSYDINKIDIFVNGQMVQSGSGEDYMLNTSKTGSIQFAFDLLNNDNIVAIVS